MDMVQQPLISVIIPVYGVEQYLDQCVRSVLAQTYTNLEIILVDDGSPDRCGEMCEAYKAADPRVKVVHRENGGLPVARNSGMEIAHGEYVGFVDSDDFIEPDMYEKLMNALLAHPEAGIASGVFSYCDEEGEPLEEKYQSFTQNMRVSGVFSSMEMLEKLAAFRGENFVMVWRCLYARHIIDKCPFTPKQEHEDEVIIHRMYDEAKNVVLIPDVIYHYRMRADSILNSPDIRAEERIASVDAFLDRTRLCAEKGSKKLATANFFGAYMIACLVRGMFDYDDPEVKESFDRRFAAMEEVYRQNKKYIDWYMRLFYPPFRRNPASAARIFLWISKTCHLGLEELMTKSQLLSERKAFKL